MKYPSTALLAVALMIAALPAAAQAPRPASLSASQIDVLLGEASRLGWERSTVAGRQAAAFATHKDLQQVLKDLTEDARRYREAVAAHDLACKGRDWTLPSTAQCQPNKDRLDEWQRTSLLQVADYRKRNLANQGEITTLTTRLGQIDARITAIDASLRVVAPFVAARQCVQPAPTAHLECLSAFWAQIDGLIRLQLDNIAYQYSYPQSTPAQSPFTRRTQSLLVGGTGWIYGYYAPGANPALRVEQEKNLRQQLSLAGLAPERFVDRADYDMMIGVAQSHSQFVDLVGRVVFGLSEGQLPGDQFSAGAFSTANRQLYAALKGTQTARLDCHSNGAMVCLEALRNGDIAAGAVRLFGPQLTPQALARWEMLLRGGKITSLEVNLMQGDPIGPASYGFGRSPKIYAALELGRLVLARGAITILDAFTPDAAARLKTQIQEYAPAISVNVIDDPACRQQLATELFACHDMALYQQRVRRN